MKSKTLLLLLGVLFIDVTVVASAEECSCSDSKFKDGELDAFYNLTKLIGSFIDHNPINEKVVTVTDLKGESEEQRFEPHQQKFLLNDFKQHMKQEENLTAKSVDMGWMELSLLHQMVIHKDVKKIMDTCSKLDNLNIETISQEVNNNIPGQSWRENAIEIRNDLATERDNMEKNLDKITNYLHKELSKIDTDLKQIKKLYSETVQKGVTNEIRTGNKIEAIIKNVVIEIQESMQKREERFSIDITRQLNEMKNFILDQNEKLNNAVNVKLFKINKEIKKKTIQQLKPFDCSDIKRSGITISGVYTIYPFSNDANSTRQVFCDLESEGTAWTVFLARLKQPQQLNFTRAWDDYKNGFGSPDAEYWLGNEVLHSMTSNQSYAIKVEFSDSNSSYWAEFSSFYVGSEDSKYQFKVAGYNTSSSVKENVILNLNGNKFSTIDQDNNKLQGLNCPEICRGGWWYYSCFDIHGTGLYDSKKYCSAMMVAMDKFVYPSRFKMKIRPNN